MHNNWVKEDDTEFNQHLSKELDIGHLAQSGFMVDDNPDDSERMYENFYRTNESLATSQERK
jgi:hypothetical protein